MTTTIAVHTAGLNDRTRAELGAGLSGDPQVDLRHFPGWCLTLLHAEVIVLGTDDSAGQEVLDMLKSYGGVKQLRLVTFSENDERIYAVGGHRGRPSFAFRLEHALRLAGCRNVAFVPPPHEPASLEPYIPGFPSSETAQDIWWRD